MLTHFRKRFRQKSLEKINEAVAQNAKEMDETESIIDRMHSLQAKPAKPNLCLLKEELTSFPDSAIFTADLHTGSFHQ